MPLQEITRTLDRVEKDGEKLLRLRWLTHAMGREVTDELILDAETLVPRTRVMPQADGSVATLEFDGARIEGSVVAADGALVEEIDVTFSTALHDASLPLLAALPLKSGASFRLPTLALELGASRAEPNWIRVIVGERGPCALGDGFELEAWSLELTPEGDGPRTKLWLADEEPFILRKEISLPGFGEVVWELKPGG